MPRADGKFINSWDRAQAHGNIWLSNSDVHWMVHAPKGKVFPESERDEWEGRRWSPHAAGTTKTFKTFTEAAEWAQKRYGIAGWKRDNMGAYHPSETDRDLACVGGGLRTCNNKRKPGEDACGVHLRSRRIDAERRAHWDEQGEKWKRDHQLSADCRAAAEPLGIPIGKGRHVQMHAEDFLALCRELEELRGFREFL